MFNPTASCADRKLKKEVDLIQTGHMDSQLKDLWTEITQYEPSLPLYKPS